MAKTKSKPPVQFDATVVKVMTLVDGGLRISFDLPESAIPAAGKLMELKRESVALKVTVVEDDS